MYIRRCIHTSGQTATLTGTKVLEYLTLVVLKYCKTCRSDMGCDRRMRCVGGACLFTVLGQGGGENGDRQRVDTNTEKAGSPIFQRRQVLQEFSTTNLRFCSIGPLIWPSVQSSPQVGLEVQYKNEFMSPDGFLAALANLLPGS